MSTKYPTELPPEYKVGAIQGLSISYMVWERICAILDETPMPEEMYGFPVTLKSLAVEQLHEEGKFSAELTYRLVDAYSCGCCLYVRQQTYNYDGMSYESCTKHCPALDVWVTYDDPDEDKDNVVCADNFNSPYSCYNESDTRSEMIKHARVMADELNKLIIERIKV